MSKSSLQTLASKGIQVTIGGEKYQLSGMTHRVIQKLEEYIQEGPLRKLEGRIKKFPLLFEHIDMPRAIKRAENKGQKFLISSSDIDINDLATVEQIIWLLLQLHHSADFPTVDSVVLTISEFESVLDTIHKVWSPDDGKKKSNISRRTKKISNGVSGSA